jgi:serine/threonine protein kinase
MTRGAEIGTVRWAAPEVHALENYTEKVDVYRYILAEALDWWHVAEIEYWIDRASVGVVVSAWFCGRYCHSNYHSNTLHGKAQWLTWLSKANGM